MINRRDKKGKKKRKQQQRERRIRRGRVLSFFFPILWTLDPLSLGFNFAPVSSQQLAMTTRTHCRRVANRAHNATAITSRAGRPPTSGTPFFLSLMYMLCFQPSSSLFFCALSFFRCVRRYCRRSVAYGCFFFCWLLLGGSGDF